MPKLKTGDCVSCRVKSAVIVGPYRSYDDIKSFVIVSVDDYGYYLFVPHYYTLKNSIVCDRCKIRNLDIDPKYLDENIVYIQENLVAAIESINMGISCKICKEHFPYAESNQDDGSMLCFSCRANPYR